MLAKGTIELDDLNSNYEEYCTVGKLLDFIKTHNIPDDAKVCIQRVEDTYFENNHWSTVKKNGFMYYIEAQRIEKAKNGYFSNREEFPDLTVDDIQEIIDSEKDLYLLQEEYVPAFSPVKYDNDNTLYLDAHY